MAHTPGPWRVGGTSGNTGEAEEIAAGLRIIAWTADTYNEDEDEGEVTDEDRANARLIAAAPELLAACTAVANDCERVIDGDDCSGMSDAELFGAFLDTLRAAIAKAEGRTYAVS